MKIYLSSLFITIFLVAVSSCKKEKTSVIPDHTANDSIIIRSLFFLDTAQITGDDTLAKFFFSYDVNKRLSNIKEHINKHNTNTLSFTTEFKCQYSGSDSLPDLIYVTTSNYVNFPFISSSYDTVYLSYQNGMIIKDSAFYISGTNVLNVNIIDFKKIDNTSWYYSYMPAGQPATNSNTFHCYANWQNGNLIESIDSINPAGNWVQVRRHQFSYDNHSNPIRKALYYFPVHINLPGYYLPNFGPFVLTILGNTSKNNVTWQNYNSGNEITTWDYTYDSKGLPATAIWNNGGIKRKLIYQYTRL